MGLEPTTRGLKVRTGGGFVPRRRLKKPGFTALLDDIGISTMTLNLLRLWAKCGHGAAKPTPVMDIGDVLHQDIGDDWR